MTSTLDLYRYRRDVTAPLCLHCTAFNIAINEFYFYLFIQIYIYKTIPINSNHLITEDIIKGQSMFSSDLSSH